jgi:two-component system sensor histidine kinase PilS (NtrC family)
MNAASFRPAGEPKLRPSGGLLTLRLVLFCLVVGACLYQGHLSGGLHALLWCYFAATLTFLLFYRRWRETTWRRLARYAGALQLLLEIAVEGALVARTDAFTSPYILLFLLTIVSASLQFRLVGTLLVATTCSFTVAVAVFLAVVGSHPTLAAARDFSVVLDLNDDLFYALFLYVCAFYLAAFVSGYLSEKLELQDRALEGASRALALARLETDDILRHMQSGLLTLDAQGTVVYFNHTAGEILGLPEREVTGRPCQVVFGAMMPELAAILLGALRDDGSRSRRELSVRTAKGRILPLGISTSLMGSPQTGIRGVIAIFQDLTEAKRLEDRMRVADRLAAVGELSASIAHEIRNPLATVTGSVEMLRREASLDEEGRSLMEMILKESARLNRIVEDFLNFARIKQQACQKVDLVAVAGEVRRLFEHHPARGESSQITVTAESDELCAAGAEEQIKQMLVNLVQNALEALPPEGGEVRIELRSVAPHESYGTRFVEAAVIDSGAGIPAAVCESIGQPFYSTKKTGTGLGLAIVQRLAMASGGSLRWASEPGQGARFTVRLPVYSPDVYLREVSGLAAVANKPLA